MNPAALVPLADPLSAPAWLLEALSLLTFTAHLLLMNATFGGAAVTLVERLRAKGTAAPDGFAKLLPTGLALTVNLGVPPLLFAQLLYGQYLYPSAILAAFYWLSVAGLAMLAYYGLYLNVARSDSPPAANLALAVSVLLLACAGFVFSNVMTLMLSPERWRAWFRNDAGTLLNLGDPTLLPRWLHFMAAALAMGGLARALWHDRRSAIDPAARQAVERGLGWFNWATLAQIVLGGWFFASLPRSVQAVFLGDDLLAGAALALGLFGTVAALAMSVRGRPSPTALAAALVVLLMVAVRTKVRDAYLAATHAPGPVHTQIGPLVLFLLALVGTLLLVAWMLKIFVQAGARRKEA